jgi:hypothetical protein
MSKKVGFPVMSASITGYLYVLALILGSLTLLVSGLGLPVAQETLVNALLFFIGAFFAGWAMLSFALHPALDSNQRLIATIFTAILLLVYFNAGVHFTLTF